MNMKDLSVLPLPLNMTERQELERYEGVIYKGLQVFYAVGTALVEIRNRKLYRADYGTFEDYCRERWNISRSYAYRLIDSAEIVDHLATNSALPLPEHEKQARELDGLEPDQQRQVWAKAVETAPNGKITAKHIKDVRQVEIPIPEPTAAPVTAPVKQMSVCIPADDEHLPDCPLCDPPVGLKYKTYGKHGIFCPTCHREWPNVEVMKSLWETPAQDDDPAEREPEAVVSGVMGSCHFCDSGFVPVEQLYSSYRKDNTLRGHICRACASKALHELLDPDDPEVIADSQDKEQAFHFMHQDRARMCAAGLTVLRVDLYKRIIFEYHPQNGGVWKPRLKCRNDGDMIDAVQNISAEPNTIFENRL